MPYPLSFVTIHGQALDQQVLCTPGRTEPLNREEEPMNKITLKAYAEEESEKIRNGERLLAPEQVMERLTITRRQLQALHRGVHPRGLYLPAYHLGRKTIRYRLADVLRIEWESLQGGDHV